ncbi:MAG: hypothetical protein FJ161_04005, partial [Gammaproteobacteria bacterium]|nr:hypothetical protein [Gammaproteobacteria bacterium]
MNLPNAMSFARLIVGLALLISYLFLNISISHIGFLFIIAALSDGLDGYIARRYNCCTAYGAWLDHLSDKVLVSSALIILSWVYPTIYIRTAVWIMIQREYLALAA